MRTFSFPPVIGPEPRLLILGSIPGQRSLQMGQYYAHPQNSFWRIMADILGFNADLPYAARLGCLVKHGIALWDSLQACERPGSLDNDILVSSEVPNQVAELLTEYPGILALAFNGEKSWRTFERYVLPTLSSNVVARVDLRRMPSTSPANARQTYAGKLTAWSAIRRYLP